MAPPSNPDVSVPGPRRAGRLPGAGRVVLVTGSSSGIGREACERFARRGWTVVATMRSPEGAGPEADARIERVALDVTDEPAIRRVVARTIARHGRLDAVVANAGYALFGPHEATAPEDLRAQFATNVFGALDLVRAALPHFRERRAGTVVVVASIGGKLGSPFLSAYHATKWAVDGFCESLQYELRPLGVRVKVIEPGPIRTDFYGRSLRSVRHEAYDAAVARVAKGFALVERFGAKPGGTARAIVRAAESRLWRLRAAPAGELILALRRVLPDALFAAIIRAGT